jgi:signal transduction histidine kinase
MTAADRITSREHRGTQILCGLIILAAAWRRLEEISGTVPAVLVLGLLGLFSVLWISEHFLARRFPRYPYVYFAAQFAVVQAFAAIRDPQDTWALLYSVLAIQAAYRLPRRAAYAGCGLFAAATAVTESLLFGLLSGLGRAAAFIVIGAFIVLIDSQYAQREDAREESRMLLEELREAHRRLAENAARAEALAAARERDRILRELHDSVGQKVFAIQLAAESTLLLLDKDPRRADDQLALLQEETRSALEQMRQLIEQWKPGGAA